MVCGIGATVGRHGACVLAVLDDDDDDDDDACWSVVTTGSSNGADGEGLK